LKVLVLGDSGVGKTSLINTLVNKKFKSNNKSNIGADFMTKEIMINNRLVVMQMWDTAGQERFNSLGQTFYRGADCCALVYDLTKATSFEHLDWWHDEFLVHSNPSHPESFPFVVLGNKVDISEHRVVSEAHAKAWCKDKGKGVVAQFETSAAMSIQVDEAFQTLAVAALEQSGQEDMLSEVTLNNSIENGGSQSYCYCS